MEARVVGEINDPEGTDGLVVTIEDESLGIGDRVADIDSSADKLRRDLVEGRVDLDGR